MTRIFGFEIHRAKPWPGTPEAPRCPATQGVNRARKGAFIATTRQLLVETGKQFPAVQKMVGIG